MNRTYLNSTNKNIREYVKMLTLDENVNRLTFEPDPPPLPIPKMFNRP